MLQAADSIQIQPQPTVNRPLAWRIANNMQGCSPARIDSVIQVHLRQHERHPSQRPDTLEIPGLPTQPINEAGLYQFGQRSGQNAFAKDSFYRPELPPMSRGQRGVSQAYRVDNDNYVTGSLLVCLLMLVYALNHSRYQLSHQLHEFFYPPHERSNEPRSITFAPIVSFLTTVMLSLMGGLIAFVVAQSRYNLFLSQLSPYLLLFIYMGLFLALFLIKRLAQEFVGWVFFSPLRRSSWRESTSLVGLLQCAAIFPLGMVFLYFRLSPLHTLWSIVAVVGIGKLMLMWRARTILFPHFGLTLHLFVYLCTLEIMPLLALWKIMEFITDNLIVKY